MMITCSMPAATASSTAYWMTGLSTSGSISFGCALVAGRNLVPQPAAGKTAFRTRIEPRIRGRRGWVGRGYHRPPPGPPPAGGGRSVPLRTLHGPGNPAVTRPFRGSARGRGGASGSGATDGAARGGRRDLASESPDRRRERLGLIEVRQMGRAADDDASGVGGAFGERPLRRPEEQVELTVDDEDRPGVAGE